MYKSDYWSVDAQAKLDQLYQYVIVEEKSFLQASRLMRAPSRNAVIGKFQRLRKADPEKWKLTGNRTSAMAFSFGRAERKKPAPKPAPPPPPETIVPLLEEGEPLTLENIKRSQCQYPFGDPSKSDFHYCGHPVTSPGKPYCPTHHALCYIKNTPRKVANG